MRKTYAGACHCGAVRFEAGARHHGVGALDHAVDVRHGPFAGAKRLLHVDDEQCAGRVRVHVVASLRITRCVATSPATRSTQR